MRQKFIKKLILGTMVSTTLCTLVPVKASAEWVQDYQSNWYYSQNNEKMKGWQKIDGQIYYFNDNGKMQTGWIKSGSTWNFLQSNGALKIGWINYNKNLYYADSSGTMQTGTINIAGKVYIFDDNGIAKTSNTIIDGQFYTIGLDGEVVGSKVPTPDKEFDISGNLVTVLKNTDNKVTTSPTDSKFNEVIEDQSVSDDDPNEGRTFKVKFKDSNGAELKTKSVKNGRTVDLYKPTKDGYVFGSWDTKSDGSGKNYASDDSIKVKEDINLYAQWTDDTNIYVDGISISGSANVAINKTTVMTAEISPSDATNTNVTWSVSPGTGEATIDSDGVLTGVSNGTVTVKATAKDGSKVSGTKEVRVSATEIVVPVSSISVTSKTGISTITANGGTLQMEATVLPTDANNEEITWSIEDRTGSASIDSTGLVTAKTNGVVTVKATAKDGSEVVGSTTITITGQLTKVLVESIVVSGKGDATTISSDAALGGTSGTLQMNTSILPTTASNKALTWSVDDTTKAKISTTGLLTAVADGKVIVKATANDGSGKFGTVEITITNQSIKVTEIIVSGDDITVNGGESLMSASILPDTATKKTITWTVENKTGSAQINSTTGNLTALSNGIVTVKATATDGSKVVGTRDITITGQSNSILVASIVVSGTNNASSITTDDGTLQMIASVLPTYATTTSSAIAWSVSSGTGTATISTTGNLKAVTNGTVTVKATSTDGSNVVGTKTITLSGQVVKVESIGVSSASDEVAVDGTLQMSATVKPDNASNKSVIWSVDSVTGGTGGATITQAGLLKGTAAGEVNVIATAADKSGIVGSKKITIISKINVTKITVNAPADSSNTIESENGTLQMESIVEPTDATNKDITWSVEKVGDTGTEMTGSATISTTGLLTAVANGTVTVKATANDGSGIVGKSEVITIKNQVVKATGFTVTALDGFTNTITVDQGSLQMQATILPTNATTTTTAVAWSVEKVGDVGTKMTGNATIDSNGKLTATGNGTVTVKMTGITDGTVISGSAVITISGQIVNVTGIAITTTTTTVGIYKTLQMATTITPTTATNKAIEWKVTNIDGSITSNAVIDTAGMLTGASAGIVTVTATSKENPTISATKNITIG